MKRTVQVALVAVVVAALALAPQAFARPQHGPSLTSSLELSQWTFGLTDEVAMTFTLTNEGSEAVSVLRWQTPVAGIEADIFAIARDGEPVPYQGMLAKRPAPNADDYLTLQPGESVTVTVDPSAAYDMTITGAYTIRYAPEFRLAEVGEVQLFVEGRDREEPREPVVSTFAKKPPSGGGEFTNCTTTQQNTLLTAKANALSISGKAQTHLNTYPNGSSLYTQWFGVYTSQRFATVDSHFDAIVDAFATKPVTFDCSCKQRYYAYVYPTQPYKIYLCSVFWTAPALGRDSKAGTLVHEMSHFNVTAGTDDYVYGATGAANLAITDPAKAVNNADNHEYFAEDQK